MSDLYDLSDEELANLDLDTLNTEEPEPQEEELVDEEPVDETPEEEEEALEAEADDQSETEAASDEDFSEETPEQEDEDTEEDLEEDTNVADNVSDKDTQEDVDAEGEEKGNKQTKKDKEEKSDSQSTEDLQSFYDAVTAEFKANGKDMRVTNPADIKALIQQGVNYSKKMAGLKPVMPIVKTLQEHGLADPAKISYLIDLHNKDPKAIAKLVKDSGTDLYEFDSDAGDNYVAVNKVHEESKLDEVMQELDSSPKFNEMLESLSGSWDTESKQFIVDNPGVLRVLNQQMDSGMFGQITNGIEYERMCGRLKDVSYIEAYSQVENAMAQANQPKEKEEAAPVLKAPRPKAKVASNSSKKRKVASPQSGGSNAKESFNPLEVSDEELLDMMDQQSKY